MTQTDHLLNWFRRPRLNRGTLILSFTGWMDGGDVSTGTVRRLVELLDADPVAEIDPDPFYIFNFPGSMEIAALFRPHIEVERGQIAAIDLPRNTFFVHEPADLALFIGKEPNLLWRTFGDCLFRFVREAGVSRIIFVGSFGGSVPHTRQPHLYFTCSDPKLASELKRYGLRPSQYEGPGSFTSYLMTRASGEQVEMFSIVAEIPGYLQGTNPVCIEAVSRTLAKILKLSLDLDELRAASTQWELRMSSLIEEDEELARKVRQLEEEYDNNLLETNPDLP